MTERRGTKALELWCRRITDGYPGVNVQNMTTSWRDGLAFCAMIHHFRPDLIDFDSLNKDDVYGNNELAFGTAAQHLGIPALLDAEDMASCSVPDRLSILTYLSQFYQHFGGSSPSRLALGGTKESSNEGISPVVGESAKPKMGPRVGMRREICAVCEMPVFLAEKLMISRTPYHRTCFRCARCDNQLTPGDYYETEKGQYCCETCPDEEERKKKLSKAILHQPCDDVVALGHHRDASQQNSYRRSLSDEEKSERRARLTDQILDRVGHFPGVASTAKEKRCPNEAPVAKNISQTAQMRVNFMASHMLSENKRENLEKLARTDQEYSSGAEGAEKARIIDSSAPPGDNFPKSRSSPEGALTERNGGDGRVDAAKMPSSQVTKDRSSQLNSLDIDINSGSIVCKKINETDNLDDRLDDAVEIDERTTRLLDTATSEATRHNDGYSRSEDKDRSTVKTEDTKDTLGLDVDRDANEPHRVIATTSGCSSSSSLSLVQRRLKMFENSEKNFEEKRKGESNIVSPLSPNVDEDSFVDGTNEIYKETKSIGDNELGQREISSEIDLSPRSKEDKEDEEVFVSPDKIEGKLAPIIPKCVSPEARKVAKSRAMNAEVSVLNAPGIDLSAEETYPEDLNPFKSDKEEDAETMVGRNFVNSRISKVSTNPFGSSDEDDEKEESEIIVAPPPRPATRSNIAGKKSAKETKKEIEEAPTKRRLKAPRIQLNPFWSDDEDNDDDDDNDDEEEEKEEDLSENESEIHGLPADTPIPKPRTIKETSQRKTDVDRGDIYASDSSLGSAGSASTPGGGGGTYRKKKPAPPPPIAKELFASSAHSLVTPNRRLRVDTNNSLHAIPRARKAKPAPPPPSMPTSTPCSTNLIANLTLTESPIIDSDEIMESETRETWDDPKIGKNEANRNKRSMMTLSPNETNVYGDEYTDKSIQGKWKRKKGPAPARPIPHRRKIKVMSLKNVKLELDEIEMQQQGLEKQGVRLEQLIRDKAETGNAAEDTSLGMDVEELVLELFALVNEKNELFRRQAELMLLRRQQRLEEEHADIEYQIRCLLCQPEATKTDFDKQREETLIQRLVEIVERRNEIVECLEMDRRREVEEDRSINTRMGLYAAKNKGDFARETEDDENNRSRKSKKIKLKEKAKVKILGKIHKKDADKDVDETEVKLKRQNKRKWF